MSDYQSDDQTIFPGINKRPNKSPILEDSTDTSLTARQKRQRTRSIRLLEMETIEKKLDGITADIKALSTRSDSSEKKLDKLLDAIKSTNVKVDALVVDVSTTKDKTKALEENQENLREDINSLKNDIGRLTVDLGTVQQNSLSNHFVIFGLPYDLAVDKPFAHLSQITNKLNVAINERDLKHLALRKNDKFKNSYLTGIFYDNRVRQQLFDQAKSCRPIVVETIFTTLPGNSTLRGKEITLKGQVAPAIRSRLAEAHRINNNVFKFIWQKDGRILMRKDMGHPVFEIKTTEQLMDLLAKYPTPHAQLSRNDQQKQITQSSSAQNALMDISPPRLPASTSTLQSKQQLKSIK